MIYAWKNNEKRKTLFGRVCKIIAYGKKNSIQIEFLDDKSREITSRYAVKKEKK